MAEGDAKGGPSSPAIDSLAIELDDRLFVPRDFAGFRVRSPWNLGEMKAALTALDLIRTPDEPIVLPPC